MESNSTQYSLELSGIERHIIILALARQIETWPRTDPVIFPTVPKLFERLIDLQPIRMSNQPGSIPMADKSKQDGTQAAYAVLAPAVSSTEPGPIPGTTYGKDKGEGIQSVHVRILKIAAKPKGLDVAWKNGANWRNATCFDKALFLALNRSVENKRPVILHIKSVQSANKTYVNVVGVTY